MSGHTKGPWFVKDFPLNAGVICSQHTGDIAIAYTNINRDDPMTLANARLIAAAPELLAACKDLAYSMAPHADEPEYPLWKAAHAAIAKATGQT